MIKMQCVHWATQTRLHFQMFALFAMHCFAFDLELMFQTWKCFLFLLLLFFLFLYYAFLLPLFPFFFLFFLFFHFFLHFLSLIPLFLFSLPFPCFFQLFYVFPPLLSISFPLSLLPLSSFPLPFLLRWADEVCEESVGKDLANARHNLSHVSAGFRISPRKVLERRCFSMCSGKSTIVAAKVKRKDSWKTLVSTRSLDRVFSPLVYPCIWTFRCFASWSWQYGRCLSLNGFILASRVCMTTRGCLKIASNVSEQLLQSWTQTSYCSKRSLPVTVGGSLPYPWSSITQQLPCFSWDHFWLWFLAS